MKNLIDLSILVCSSDNYSDLWEPFFKLLDKYWNEIPCKIILNTESKNFQFKKLIINSYNYNKISKRKSLYGERMIYNLNIISTKYTLLLLDDFFIRRDVDTERISEIIKWMEEDQKIACFSFDESKYISEKSKYNGFGLLKRFSPYKLNMQAGIWRTQTLIKYWKKYDNPWIWEIFGNYQTFDEDDKFYAIKSHLSSPIYYGYNPDGMGVFRGKWVIEDVASLFAENNINVDYNKRGIYHPEIAKTFFDNKVKTLYFLLKRVKLKYAISLICFEIKKRIYKFFKRDFIYNNHSEYLIAKNKNKKEL